MRDNSGKGLTNRTKVTVVADEWSEAGPEAMRQRLADYVYALHRAYVSQAAQLTPAERAALPLMDTTDRGSLTVAIAAATELHLIATTEPLPTPRGQEVELTDEIDDLRWRVRFFDPSILPGLGVLARAADGGDDPLAVRRCLGVADVAYHLSVSPGGGLGEHHAQHAGVALANQHAAAARDGAALRAAYPHQTALVDEFLIAGRVGLPQAARLLAQSLAGSALTSDDAAADHAGLRRALLRIAKEGR